MTVLLVVVELRPRSLDEGVRLENVEVHVDAESRPVRDGQPPRFDVGFALEHVEREVERVHAGIRGVALETIRERGYAIDDEERVEGMRCIAAPITDQDGRAIAAVSIPGPKSRMRGEDFEETFPNTVLRSANVIEVNLTHS